MKIDLFDAIVWVLFGSLAVLAALEAWTWLAAAVRERLRRRHLRRLGLRERPLPRPNAGFLLRRPSSAARRHHGREEEDLLIRHPWSLTGKPPAGAGGRRLRDPD